MENTGRKMLGKKSKSRETRYKRLKVVEKQFHISLPAAEQYLRLAATPYFQVGRE